MFQRIVLLERLGFGDESGRVAAAELADAFKGWIGDVRLGKVDHRPRHALLYPDDRIISAHPFTPAIRLIGRFPDVAASIADELKVGYRVLEENNVFEGEPGRELKQAMETALERARGDA